MFFPERSTCAGRPRPSTPRVLSSRGKFGRPSPKISPRFTGMPLEGRVVGVLPRLPRRTPRVVAVAVKRFAAGPALLASAAV